MEKARIDLENAEKRHELAKAKRTKLQLELNKLNAENLALKNKDESNQTTLNYYKHTYENLITQSHNILLQHNRAKLAGESNAKIIENHQLTMACVEKGNEESGTNSTFLAKELESLTQEKEALQSTIIRNNTEMQTNQ